MTVRRSRGVPRSGYTLIELLIVTIIIAILVSLLLAGVMKALERGPEIQTRVEIGEMDAAVQSVVQKYELKFVPSQIKLSETWNYPGATPPGTSTYNALDYNSVQFLKRMFPRLPQGSQIDWNRNGKIDTVDVTLQGPECLVFFLGGPGNVGFSADPANPANTVSIQPQAFEFKTSRLIASPNVPASPGVSGSLNPSGAYYVYLNNYGKKAQPYLYFTSYYQGNDYQADCASYGVSPYVDPNTNRFINPNGYQIVTAGQLGVFGAGGTLWNPRTGSTDKNTLDNQANFAPSLLRAGQ